jgi:PAS domain S-box-containing protein
MEHVSSKHESPVRLFLQLFLPALVLIVGGAWYIGHDRIRSEVDLLRTNEIGNVIVGVRRLDDELSLPLRQLHWLAAHPAVREAVDAGKPAALQGVMADLIATGGLYDKIRWVDEHGLERVRVDAVAGLPVVTTEQANVSGRYYYTAAMKLKPGQVTISPLDLNTERGQISQPPKPVLRLSMPVSDAGGHPRGVLILNVAAKRLLDAFTASLLEARDHVMLLNDDGYGLRSPDSANDWGFMFGSKNSLGSRNPAAWQAISTIPSGEEELGDGLWTWSTVYPLKVVDDVAELPHWLVVSHLPQSELDLIGYRVWPQVGGSAAVLLLLFGGIAAWLSRALSERTQARVEAARAHAEAAAAQRLNESLERFHLIVEANVNGVLAVDSQGRIVLANPALAQMFGYDRDELLGKPMELLVPESHRGQHGKHRDAYIRSPAARPMGAGRELTGRHKDGSEFPVEVSLSPFTEHGEQFVDAIVVDLSGRR